MPKFLDIVERLPDVRVDKLKAAKAKGRKKQVKKAASGGSVDELMWGDSDGGEAGNLAEGWDALEDSAPVAGEEDLAAGWSALNT